MDGSKNAKHLATLDSSAVCHVTRPKLAEEQRTTAGPSTKSTLLHKVTLIPSIRKLVRKESVQLLNCLLGQRLEMEHSTASFVKKSNVTCVWHCRQLPKLRCWVTSLCSGFLISVVLWI